MPPPDANSQARHRDATGWVLGALDPADAEAFEVHLRDCPECQTTVAGFEAVARALKSPAPAVEPSADLEGKTVASVQHAVLAAKGAARAKTADSNTIALAIPVQEGLVVAGVPHGGSPVRRPEQNAESQPAKRTKWWQWHWSLPVFSVAAACGAAIAAIVIVVAQQVTQATPGLAVAKFDLRPVSGHAAGTVIVHRGGNGWTLDAVLRNLPPLRAKQYYECWYLRSPNDPPSDAITGGSFTSGSSTGNFTMNSAADPHNYKIMEIAIQRPGDSGRPGTVILRGTGQPA